MSLIIVNVIQLYLLLQTNKKYDSILRSAIEQSNTYLLDNFKLKTLIKTIYSNESNYPNCFMDVNNDTSKLLFIYIPPSVCETCIRETLGNLDLLGDKIGKSRIGIVVGADSLGLFEDIIKQIPVTFGFETFCSENQFKNFPKDKPTVFIYNRQRGVHLVFVPDLFKEYAEIYFFEIVLKYFNDWS